MAMLHLHKFSMRPIIQHQQAVPLIDLLHQPRGARQQQWIACDRPVFHQGVPSLSMDQSRGPNSPPSSTFVAKGTVGVPE